MELFPKFAFAECWDTGTALAEDTEVTRRRSSMRKKVIGNTHKQMERRRERQGGGEGKELEVACNKQMER